jgi:hypothetical protein
MLTHVLRWGGRGLAVGVGDPALAIRDPDATDITIGNSDPCGGAQMSVHVSCGWCTLRAPEMMLDSLTPNFVDAACADVCRNVQLPVEDLDRHRQLPEKCRECVVTQGLVAVREGRKDLKFFASLAAANSFLADMTYRGISGYNSRLPTASLSARIACVLHDALNAGAGFTILNNLLP